MSRTTSVHRTPAGAGLVLAITIIAVALALHFTASPCERPDGTLPEVCDG